MSEDPRLYDGSAGAPPVPDPGSAWVTGGVLFAGVLMLCQGVVAALQGVAALADSDVYGTVGDYLYRFSLTSWGWIHLVIGLCAVITGAGLLKGAGWAGSPVSSSPPSPSSRSSSSCRTRRCGRCS